MIARERNVPLLLLLVVVVRAVVGEPIIFKALKQQLQLLSYRQMIRHLFSSCSSSFRPDLSCPDVAKKNYMVSRRSIDQC
jgi:hypothetical protein